MWTVSGPHSALGLVFLQCICACVHACVHVVFSEHWGFLGKLLHPLCHRAWKILTFYDDSAPLILKLALLRQGLCPQLCGSSALVCADTHLLPLLPIPRPLPRGRRLPLSSLSQPLTSAPQHKESRWPSLPRPPRVPGVPPSLPPGWRPESLPQLNTDIDSHHDLLTDSSG